MGSERDSYIVQRNGTFHYRRRVPADIQPHVGVKWWKRSLKTAQEREAESRARALASAHDRLIAKVRGLPLPEQLASVTSAIEVAQDHILTIPDSNPARAVAVGERQRLLEAEAKIRRAMLAAAEQRLDTLPRDERDAIAQSGGVEAFLNRAGGAADSVEMRRIRMSVMHGAGRISERNAETLEAALQTQARHASQDQSILAKLGALPADSEWEEPDNPRINTVIEKWFVERKQGAAAVRRHRVAVRRFTELHGNVPVGAITKQMVRDYLKKIEGLADHRRLPTEQRGGLADPGEDVARVSAPTVERHLISIKAMLKFCIEQDWLTVNVATGLKAPKDTRPKASKRRPFTREERNILLAKAVEEYGENGDTTWLIRMLAYTGCRLEEIGQLARKNVRQIDSVWVAEIDDLDGRSVKTVAKQVPLHPAIRDTFVAWVHASAGEFVFASFVRKGGRFANKLSGAGARLMDRAGLSDPRLVFHSLRHTLKREMSNARIDPDVRRLIMGHAPKDAHDEYAGHSLEAVAVEFARMPALFD